MNIYTVMKHAGGYGQCTLTRKDAINSIDWFRKEKAFLPRHFVQN